MIASKIKAGDYDIDPENKENDNNKKLDDEKSKENEKVSGDDINKPNFHLTEFETSDLVISQTLESNREMKDLKKIRKSIEQEGLHYDNPFEDQIHVYQINGVNYLVNGHHRFAAIQRLGISKIKAVIINTEYLASRYLVTPEQLVAHSQAANKIGNKIRWY